MRSDEISARLRDRPVLGDLGATIDVLWDHSLESAGPSKNQWFCVIFRPSDGEVEETRRIPYHNVITISNTSLEDRQLVCRLHMWTYLHPDDHERKLDRLPFYNDPYTMCCSVYRPGRSLIFDDGSPRSRTYNSDVGNPHHLHYILEAGSGVMRHGHELTRDGRSRLSVQARAEIEAELDAMCSGYLVHPNEEF